MAARAHEISLEAGSKMAAAMKDVISAAAGLTGFAVESARDLVQYMVRRGQMTQDEADKLIRDAEEAHGKRHPGSIPPKAPPAAQERPALRSVPAAAKPIEKPPTPVIPLKPATPVTAAPVKASAKPPAPAKAHVAKKAPATVKKTAPAKGAVKRPAVAKASAKPSKKK